MKKTTGGLNTPQTSTKVGNTPAIAGNTLMSDIAVKQPSSIRIVGKSLNVPLRR